VFGPGPAAVLGSGRRPVGSGASPGRSAPGSGRRGLGPPAWGRSSVAGRSAPGLGRAPTPFVPIWSGLRAVHLTAGRGLGPVRPRPRRRRPVRSRSLAWGRRLRAPVVEASPGWPGLGPSSPSAPAGRLVVGRLRARGLGVFDPEHTARAPRVYFLFDYGGGTAIMVGARRKRKWTQQPTKDENHDHVET